MPKHYVFKALLSTLCLCMLGSCGDSHRYGDTLTEKKSETEAPLEPSYGIRVDDIAAYTAPLRPSYHYTAKNSWINDPNGLVYFDGVWHMCYQTNPGHNENGNMHWGHAVSEDLIHWTEKDIVLYPDESGYMWSGTSYADLANRSGLFPETGKGILAAYSTDTQHIGLAYSTDGYHFEKIGIVIPNPGVKDFRDPKLFWHEESQKWIMVIAGGEVVVYSSSDLKDWTLESKTGIYTECPDLFEIVVDGTETTKWILTCGGRGYYIGHFDGKVFVPESDCIPMNYGPDSYAGILFQNTPDGRILMINWVNNWAYPSPADGIWSGAMSLPVEIRLADIPGIGLRLKQLPVSEAAVLEQKTLLSLDETAIVAEDALLSDLSSNTCKLSFAFDVEKTKDFRLELCRSDEEALVLTYQKADGTFVFDRTGLKNQIPAMKEAGTYRMTVPAEAAENGVLDVTIYLDTSTFELFVGDGLYTLTARIQPFSGSRGMALTTEEGLAITELSVTALRSIWFGDSSPAYLHLSQDQGILFPNGEPTTLLAALSNDYDASALTWRVSDPDILALTPIEGGVTVTPLSPGKATVTATYGDLSASAIYTVPDTADSTFSSQLGLLKIINGTMEKTPLGYHFTSKGATDAFLISDRKMTDFTASVNVLHMTPGGASAIVFDWQDEQNFLCLTLDFATNIVKLWGKRDGNGFDHKVLRHPLTIGEIMQLSITVAGENAVIAINDNTIFSTSLTNRRYGVLGLNIFNGETYINRVTYDVATDKS